MRVRASIESLPGGVLMVLAFVPRSHAALTGGFGDRHLARVVSMVFLLVLCVAGSSTRRVSVAA